VERFKDLCVKEARKPFNGIITPAEELLLMLLGLLGLIKDETTSIAQQTKLTP